MKYFAIIFLFLKRLFTFRSPLSALSANPDWFLSGLLQTRKSEILDPLLEGGSVLVAPYTVFGVDADMPDVISSHKNSGGKWPVVVKPNIGERGLGVFIARNEQELVDAVGAQAGEFMLQTYIAGEEFGVFIVRLPDAGKLKIFVGQKFAPLVRGDGKNTLASLIVTQHSSHQKYLLKRHRDRLDLVPGSDEIMELEEILHGFRGTSQKLVEQDFTATGLISTLDAFCGVSDFHYGRLDYRAANLAALVAGQGRVIEINGLASLPPQLSVPGIALKQQLNVMYEFWKNAYAIGDANQINGARRYSLTTLISTSLRHLAYRARFSRKSSK